MSIGIPHANMSTPCAYGGVTGVTFRFIAQFSALSLRRRLCNSLRFIANSVLSLALNIRHFASLTIVLDRLDSVHFSNPLAFA
jgi:hypothetical protein